MKYKDVFDISDSYIKGFFEDYRFLSNFHICDIYYDGLLYPSTENAYQASKFKNIEIKKKFLNISPGESKKLNRSIQLSPTDIKEFDKNKLRIMTELNCIKYSDEGLRYLLFTTGGRYLEETNYWDDTFWGVCGNKGENNLGKILMNIRYFWKIALPVYQNESIVLADIKGL